MSFRRLCCAVLLRAATARAGMHIFIAAPTSGCVRARMGSYRTHGLLPRASLLRMLDELPRDGLDMQRCHLLGELTFSQSESAPPDGETSLARGRFWASASQQVAIGLFYGELTRGPNAGMRVLIKCYRSSGGALTSERAEADAAARMRARLEVLGGEEEEDDAWDPSRSAGTSLAEVIARNEFASHRRLQAAARSCNPGVETRGVGRLLGRRRSTLALAEEGSVLLHAFPWRGEPVRMPTRLPPTLASWSELRAQGKTVSSLYLDMT